MKRKYLKFTSILLLASLVLSSCQSSKKTEIKVRSKDKSTVETEETESRITEDTDDTDPGIVVIESNLYTDADAPIVVDWDNYQKAEIKENVFERKSEDYIGEFVPSNDYGAVLPFEATYATVSEVEYEDYIQYSYYSYGLMDSQGRIICDPIFSNAYKSYGNLVIVATGDGEDKKYGAIKNDGSKFTGTKYGVFRLMYDQDLNVYVEKTVNLDLNSIDDQGLLESLEYAKESGYELLFEDIGIVRLLDRSHVIGEFWGYYFEIDLDTGKFRSTSDFFDTDLGVGGEYGDRYLTDRDGNQISDSYTDVAYGVPLPIFYKNGYYYGLDSEGNEVQKFPKTDYLDYVSYDEYVIIKTGSDKWTLFDKDFNEIGVYESDWQIYPNEWSQRSRVASDPVYVLDKGNIIDPFTGEVLLEDVPDAYYFFVGDEFVAAQTDSGFVVSNGRKFGPNEYWSTTTDLVTGKEYMICCDYDHDIRIYDVAADEIIEVNSDGYVDSYYVSIADGNAYFYSYSSDTTYMYDFTDVDEPQLLFRYHSADPLGDD